ncbi:MAG: 5-formyltetrahydrofolate cyclo-ligase [Gammaproteobacteria bacterium]|nr:5-formyltetrahydrofolate cyclo-ligase [Gammaproteobacteria bacterium]
MRNTIRQSLRSQRQRLVLDERIEASRTLADGVIHSHFFTASQHIAAYFPHDGEVSPAPILEKAWTLGKQCYLPVIDCIKQNRMHFVRYEPCDPLLPNSLGILEPKAHQKNITVDELDLILLPVVAFDKRGYRLGMGGGYYDRLLAQFKSLETSGRPRLIGLAYEFQHVITLPEEDWDIPLDAVATDHTLHVFH